MKLGLSIKIDVTKIDKTRLFQGQKGIYLDLTTFIDLENLDQYDNNGFISQETSKEERQNNVQTPILGNVKVFYNDSQNSQARQQPTHTQSQAPSGFQAPLNDGVKPAIGNDSTFEDDGSIPF